MEHDGLYDHLLLLGLLWLSMLLYWVWLRGGPATSPTPLTPALSIKKRSKEPTPFAGLLHKPLCDACAQAAASRLQAPGAPPPPLTFTRGRRRTVETRQQFCPDDDCSYYGWVGRGNIRANRYPGGKPWRQFQCVSCQGYFQETHGTPLHGKRVSSDLFVWAVGALAEGLGIRAVARGFAIDPVTKLLLTVDVGDRTRAMAQRVVHQVVQVLAPGCVPLFLTDGFKEYTTALLTHFGQWVQPPRRQDKGPTPKPRWMPVPQLLYTQVVKTVRRRRLVRVSHRVVFGTLEAINAVLAPYGWHITTAFVERINLSIRQHVAAVGR